MDEKERQLSTADLVGVGRDTDVRGRHDHEIRDRTPPAEPTNRAESGVNRTETPRPEPERTSAAPAGAPATRATVHPPSTGGLFPGDESERLRGRWSDIQATFVDSPRQAVERADELVAETMKRLAEVFATERANLEHQWDRGDSVTTEDLRVALQRYRAFFDRLLTV